MSVQSMSVQMRQVFLGNGLLIICGALYLAWWIVAFRPDHPAGVVSAWLLAGAFITGIAGLILMVKGISGFSNQNLVVSNQTLIIAGVVAYVALFLLTYFAFHRQVTSELLLIIGWAVLELAIVNVLYGSSQLKAGAAISYCVVISIAVVVSLVCYVLYYRLKGMAGYIDGMVPLLMETISMIYFAIICN